MSKYPLADMYFRIGLDKDTMEFAALVSTSANIMIDATMVAETTRHSSQESTNVYYPRILRSMEGWYRLVSVTFCLTALTLRLKCA
jgi:hypothetical protein